MGSKMDTGVDAR